MDERKIGILVSVVMEHLRLHDRDLVGEVWDGPAVGETHAVLDEDRFVSCGEDAQDSYAGKLL